MEENVIKKPKNKYRVTKWIFLGLSILINAVLIVNSCLTGDVSRKLSNSFTNIVTKIINSLTEKKPVIVPVESIKTSFSSDQYNTVLGYELNEIPLGSAKQITTTYLPDNATNKAVNYSAENPEIVTILQGGSNATLIGMDVGETNIIGKNNESNSVTSCKVKIVELVKPVTFEIASYTKDISLGSYGSIILDVDGGVLGHNELINSRYYDNRKLTYESANELIATVNSYGVIKPKAIGSTKITVSNGTVSKEIDINVIAGTTPISYLDLKLEGSLICYGNDMINDQLYNKNHHQIEVYDGETKLNPDDFIWESSNELLARVDRHGVLRGFRKKSTSDETVTITCTSKITGQKVSATATVKEELPRVMNYSITNKEKTTSNFTDYTACVGDKLIVNVSYDISVMNKTITHTVSDSTLVDCTNQGTSLIIYVKNEGTCHITIKSNINPELENSFDLIILKAGAISSEDLEEVRLNTRKIIGHAILFAIAEVFTLLTLLMFFYNSEKPLLISLISIAAELFVSITSELIQFIMPGRHGLIKDVFINFGGIVIGAVIVYLILIIFFHKKKKNKSIG